MNNLRIAVLGNSHAASLKSGWDENQQQIAGIATLDIFARPNGRGGLAGLVERDGNLVAEDEELKAWFVKTAGRDVIDMKGYDVFIVHAFGPDPSALHAQLAAFAGHHYSNKLVTLCMDEFRKGRARQIEKSPLVKLCERLRGLTGVPILATHKPMFALKSYAGAQDERAGALLYRTYIEGMANALARVQCQVLPQPPETLTGGCFTRDELAMEDMAHMNGAYGAALLRAAVAQLVSASKAA